MVHSCLLCGRRETPEKISFFHFPSQKEERKRWIALCSPYINERALKISPNTRVCQRHFTKESLRQHRERARLKRKAVPSIFFSKRISSRKTVPLFECNVVRSKSCDGEIVRRNYYFANGTSDDSEKVVSEFVEVQMESDEESIAETENRLRSNFDDAGLSDPLATNTPNTDREIATILTDHDYCGSQTTKQELISSNWNDLPKVDYPKHLPQGSMDVMRVKLMHYKRSNAILEGRLESFIRKWESLEYAIRELGRTNKISRDDMKELLSCMNDAV